MFSCKLRTKGFQRGKIIGQLVKCYCQVIEYADLKLAIRFNKEETIGDFDKDRFGGMVRMKA